MTTPTTPSALIIEPARVVLREDVERFLGQAGEPHDADEPVRRLVRDDVAVRTREEHGAHQTLAVAAWREFRAS
ncbi:MULTISPECIES: hypothetical protein [Amycolatopsis]|uniref:Uncharacterized protein n=1 Tax=Amycolatopsis thermalba TaxID=944492 RepID=A0ABY4NU33_9PSEU|nr:MULTISPECIES: hypothetical protein [Amycolatopsis]OXM73034.1 hypothetical protein CF166_12320 [Amycolatopsis sp. KNN50.9b]UQS23575.1 hypothetical protein L1857_12450 [Amycolatopsis thermalba]